MGGWMDGWTDGWMDGWIFPGLKNMAFIPIQEFFSWLKSR